MIIYFERDDWDKRRIAVIINNISKQCTATDRRVQHLKHKTLREVLQWGLGAAHGIEIMFCSNPMIEAGIRNQDYNVVPKPIAVQDEI